MRNVDTFFRGYRRETFIDGATILCNSVGEKRLKLNMRLPLSGDQLVGMPNWVGCPFDDIAKPEIAVKTVASTMELDPMLLHVFALPEGEKEVATFDAVRLCGFKIEHDGEDEHPNIVLRFTAYLPRTGKLLKFADENFGASLYIRYEAAQGSLLDDNPNVQPIDEPGNGSPGGGANGAEAEPDDDEVAEEETSPITEQPDQAAAVEADRRASLDPKLDPEFDFTNKKGTGKGRGKKVGQLRDGFGKPIPAQQVQ